MTRVATPPAATFGLRGIGAVIRRTLVSFYDDQMTHHAAALTYYALMSLFPTVLLGLSLLGLLGQYPETYDAIMGYAREVAPDSVVAPLDSSLQRALQNKGTAATAVAISVVVALYGTTGVLEAARRALNVVFEIEHGRSFLRRKLIDVASTVVLGALVLVTGILVFVGGGFADDLLGFIGLGPERRRGAGTSPAGRPRSSWPCSSSPSSTTSPPTSSSARGAG